MLTLQILFWISVLVVIHVYLGYPVGIYLKSRSQQDGAREEPPDEQLPTLTVLIPAYNEEAGLARKLENTLALYYPQHRLQVIVASDGSSDRTVEIAGQYADRGVQVSHSSERRGKMETLNRTVPMATGDIILVTDARAELSRDTLRWIARHFQDPKVGCVSGSRVCLATESVASEGEGLYWRYESWIKQAESRLGTCLGADGQVMAVRKSLFPNIPDCNDDFYVPMNILMTTSYKVRYEPRAKAWITSASSLRGEWQRKIRTNVLFFRNLPYLRMVLDPRKSTIWWRFLSHHMLRRLVPFAMASSLFLSLLLWNAGTLYRVITLVQCLFYMAAGAGLVAERYGIRFRILYVPFYFVFANAAVLLAWMYCFQGRTYSIWSRTERILPHSPPPSNMTKPV